MKSYPSYEGIIMNDYKDPYETTRFPSGCLIVSPQVAIGETQDQIDRLTTRAQISEDLGETGEFWLGG